MMSTVRSLVSRAIEEKHGGCPAKEAFTELVREYQDMVFGLVYAILRDHFLAQDVTQETFIIAYNKLDTLVEAQAGAGKQSSIKPAFKIVPGPPEGHSYAIDLACRYGISRDQLIATLESRGALTASG